ncbi:MAG TPA: PilZ domain-containing protein [Candidatus Methylomirabilis sp.]|nr:PilZ domain-containing protein [Candidatus Methylomirabilis sp.]HSB79388.1 PilZ domain-containing protein [Candidatus Methylomirabilis sp.]HSC71151.1 PilZ domain-containing protein [Candidatus Methylomirabilis sp.]
MIHLKATRKGTWTATASRHRAPGQLDGGIPEEGELVGEYLTRDAAVDAARQYILEKLVLDLGASGRDRDTPVPSNGAAHSLGGNGSGVPALPERRHLRRVTVGRHIPALAHGTLPVRLVDLSLGGARIEHLGQLRPGSPCALEFPGPVGPLRLATHVVRSTVVSNRRRPRGDRYFRYESGLAFADVSPGQETALTDILGRVFQSN